MLSVDGNADAAVEARIKVGWNKFKQMAPLVTSRNISLVCPTRAAKYCKEYVFVCQSVCPLA